MQIAKWKRGFEGMYNADAQKVAEEIMSIGVSATPEQIVDMARDESTELHKCFTWDDSVAAEKWRKHEASRVVHFLVIEQPRAKKKEQEIRFFYKTGKDSGYKTTEYIFQNQDEHIKLLHRALMELEAFRRKYSFLTDSDEMQKLLNTIEELINAA